MPPQQAERLADLAHCCFDFCLHCICSLTGGFTGFLQQGQEAVITLGMTHEMLLLPTFDGQTKGVAAVNPAAIDLIRPAVMPGMTNVYVSGDQSINCLGVFMEMKDLLGLLERAGFSFLNLAGDALNAPRPAPKPSDGH